MDKTVKQVASMSNTIDCLNELKLDETIDSASNERTVPDTR